MREDGPDAKQPGEDHAAVRALYGWRAGGYELQLAPYEFIRRMAVDHLQLRPGQVVLDLGCGTGMSLPMLREAVGPSGRVLGVDLSPEMLVQARQRVQRTGWSNVQLQCAPAETALLPHQADAALLHFTHDILQSPQALENLLRHLRPGARIVATGLKWTAPGLSPWNALVALHMVQSVTHYEGLRTPWLSLQQHGVQLEVDMLVMGTVFVAHGVWPGRWQAQGIDERR